MRHALIAILLAVPLLTWGQNCPYFRDLLQLASKAWALGDYDGALNQLAAAREACPDSSAQVDAQLIRFTQQIAAKYAEARAEKLDLAYKSNTALRDGYRNAAFRLAEFDYRYNNPNNPRSIQCMMDALYYNDNKVDIINQVKPPLVRQVGLIDSPKEITAIAFSPTGDTLAIGFQDGEIQFWDSTQQQCQWRYQCHGGAIREIDFSHNGSLFAIGSENNMVYLWDAGKATIIDSIHYASHGQDNIAFSPSDSLLAITATYSTVWIWSLAQGKPIDTLEGNEYHINCLAFSPDGRYLATAARDYSFKIWNLQSHTAVTVDSLGYHVDVLAFDPRSQRLATGGRYGGGTLDLWNAWDGSPVRSYAGHEFGVRAIQLSGFYGTNVLTWDGYNTMRNWRHLEDDGAVLHGSQRDPIHLIATCPGKRIWCTTGKNGAARIWKMDLDTGAVTIPRMDHVEQVIFAQDGKSLLALTETNTIQKWDIARREIMDSVPGDTKAFFLPQFAQDGSFLLTVSENGEVTKREVGKHQPAQTFSPTGTSLISMALSPDGKLLAAGKPFELHEDDPEERYTKASVVLWNLQQGRQVHAFKGFDWDPYSLAFSPDGRELAAGFVDGSITIWNVQQRIPIRTIRAHRAIAQHLTYTSNGKYLISTGSDSTMRIWKLSGKDNLYINELDYGQYIISLEAANNGLLALAGYNNTIMILDSYTGANLFVLETEYDANSISFSQDGKRMVTAYDFVPARIWELDAQALIRRWKETGPVVPLSLAELKEYHLEDLLSLHPENEAKLISTRETWQIKAFADLAAYQAEGSNMLEKVRPHFERADRLYTAALALQNDPTIRQAYARLLLQGAAVYESQNQTAKATTLKAKAYHLWKE